MASDNTSSSYDSGDTKLPPFWVASEESSQSRQSSQPEPMVVSSLFSSNAADLERRAQSTYADFIRAFDEVEASDDRRHQVEASDNRRKQEVETSFLLDALVALSSNVEPGRLEVPTVQTTAEQSRVPPPQPPPPPPPHSPLPASSSAAYATAAPTLPLPPPPPPPPQHQHQQQQQPKAESCDAETLRSAEGLQSPSSVKVLVKWSQVLWYTDAQGKQKLNSKESPVPAPYPGMTFKGYDISKNKEVVHAWFVRAGSSGEAGVRMHRPKGGVNRDFHSDLAAAKRTASGAELEQFKEERKDSYVAKQARQHK